MSRVWVFDEITLQAALAAWHAQELHLPADRQDQVLAFLHSEAVRQRGMSRDIAHWMALGHLAHLQIRVIKPNVPPLLDPLRPQEPKP